MDTKDHADLAQATQEFDKKAFIEVETHEKLALEFIQSGRTTLDRDMDWAIRTMVSGYFYGDKSDKFEYMYQQGFSIDKHIPVTRPNFLLQYLIQSNAKKCLDVYVKYEGYKEFQTTFSRGGNGLEIPFIVLAALHADPTFLAQSLAYGVDIEATASNGDNALYFCMARGQNTDTLEYLLQQGLRPNAVSPETYDARRHNLVLLALDLGLDCTELIIRYVDNIQVLTLFHKDLCEAKNEGPQYQAAHDKIKAKLDILTHKNTLETELPSISETAKEELDGFATQKLKNKI